MTPFIAEEIAALHDLARLWTAEQMVLVGASGLRCFLEMSWRKTEDLDLSIAATVEESIGWPVSGLRMDLVGMRLAFERSVALSVGDDLEVRVAPLHVLAVLKMAAYSDYPDVREKDLGDLAHIMHEYPMDSDRRYSAEVPDDLTEFDDVGPFLLGRDIAAVVNPAEHRCVLNFIAAVEDEARGPRLLQRLALGGPVAWRNPETVYQRVLALRRGLDD